LSASATAFLNSPSFFLASSAGSPLLVYDVMTVSPILIEAGVPAAAVAHAAGAEKKQLQQ
jgi:hypothetical protein